MKGIEQIHAAMMLHAKVSIQSLKGFVEQIQKCKSKISPELLIRTMNSKQKGIRSELQANGAVLDQNYENILKNMKTSNFNFMVKIEKIEMQLAQYYNEKQLPYQRLTDQDFCQTTRTRKTKKIKREQVKHKKESEKVALKKGVARVHKEQIYEQSGEPIQNFMI